MTGAAAPAAAYHQLLRRGRGGPWQSLAGLPVLTLLVFLVPLLLLSGYGTYVAATGGSAAEATAGLSGDGRLRPVRLLILNLSWAAMIPATLLLLPVLHRLPAGWLSSLRPGIRWRWLAVCLALAVVALVSSIVVGALLPAGGEELSGLNDFTATTRDFLLVIVLTTPLQAAGEEYVFRGYLLQAVGGWIRDPRVSAVIAVTVQASVFGVAHGGEQTLPVFFDRFAFGVVAGTVVVITGGLEAGIAAHVAQNLSAFGLTLAFGDMGSALTPTGGSWWTILSTLTRSLVFLAMVMLIAPRLGVRARTGGLEGRSARG